MGFHCKDQLHLPACRAHPPPSRVEQTLDLPPPLCSVLLLGIWLMRGLTAVPYLQGPPVFKDEYLKIKTKHMPRTTPPTPNKHTNKQKRTNTEKKRKEEPL